MILTVTMNPSIDTAYQLDHLIIDDVNRVVPKKTAGGKGLNVSRVLVQLGDDVLATGLLGGHAGAYLGSLMDADNIPHRFTPIAGESRTCVAILHDGNQTELLESGPEVSAEELEAFLARERTALASVGLPVDNRPVSELSGGQRRRVALLRCVLSEASVLLFDEPLKGMDVATVARVMDYLVPLLTERTVLWVTHDPKEKELLPSSVLWDVRDGAVSRL